MRATWFGALCIGAVLTIAGCRGGSSSIPSTPVSNGTAVQPGTQQAAKGAPGTIVVVLPTIVAPKPLPTPGGVNNPYFLSSGTRSVSGSFGKTTFGPVAVSAGSPNCNAASGGGRSCTVRFQVPSGIDSLKLTTNGARASFGRLAFVPATRIKSLPNVLNYVKPLEWFGVATGVKITSSPAKASQFKPLQVMLTVTGIDGSGARIPEKDVVAATGGAFSIATTAAGPYNQTFSALLFWPTAWQYDGRYEGKEKFTVAAFANGRRVARDSVTVKLASGDSSSIGQIIAATESGGEISIAEFSSDAVGNVAPLRVINASQVPYNASSAPYGASPDGSFWIGPQQFDPLGDLLGKVPTPGRNVYASAQTVDAAQNEYASYLPAEYSFCERKLRISVFAAGSYGKTTLREVTGPTFCPPSELAVDGTGVLYAYGNPNAYTHTATLLEFPPNTSGNVPPSLTIPNLQISNIVGDASGDLYALDDQGNVLKFAPGATTPVTVLQIDAKAFALDSSGNIYAEIPDSFGGLTFQVEEFLAGATTASRIIGGSNTSLVIPAGITVLP